MRAAVFCVLLAFACAAETSVAPPLVGVVRDCAGQVHRVFGVGGAFLLGPAENTELPPEPAGAKIEGRTLILHSADGPEKRIPLPGPATGLHRMAPGWLAAPPFAIKLTAGGAIVYRLPMQACSSRAAEATR